MVEAALKALQNGDPVVLYDFDDREGEADLVYPATAVDRHAVARLRNDAGGLICTAIPADAADALGFPFIAEVLDDPMVEGSGDLDYADRSSFSYWVNHRSTRTGVTDRDRATTANALAAHVERARAGEAVDASEAFRTPGHMAVLRAHHDLLDGRRGHTEMSVALVREAGLTPVATICEMLDDATGDALSRADAEAYAAENGFVFLTGEAIAGIRSGEAI